MSVHENDAISFHDSGQNVKIMAHRRDGREKKVHTQETAGGQGDRLPVSIQPLDEVESSMQYYLSLQILIFFLYFI